MQGKIKRLVRSHGFGFIHADDGQELFFHRADILGMDFHRLREGQSVEFFLPDKTEDIRRAIIVWAGRPHERRR